jgi:hypothetical protein
MSCIGCQDWETACRQPGTFSSSVIEAVCTAASIRLSINNSFLMAEECLGTIIQCRACRLVTADCRAARAVCVVPQAWSLQRLLWHLVQRCLIWSVLSWTGKPWNDRLASLEADTVASINYLSTTEALWPSAFKLLLAACTGATVWLVLGIAWQLLCLGWGLLCVIWWGAGTTWWLASWPWINLVWRPNWDFQVGVNY